MRNRKLFTYFGLTAVFSLIVVTMLKSWYYLYLGDINWQVMMIAMIIALAIAVLLVIAHYGKSRNDKRQLRKISKMNENEFEDLIIDHFSKSGYQIVSQSKYNDYWADLIVSKYDRITVLKFDHLSKTLASKIIQETVAAKHYYKAHRAIVITTSNCNSHVRKIARNSGVEIWSDIQIIDRILSRL